MNAPDRPKTRWAIPTLAAALVVAVRPVLAHGGAPAGAREQVVVPGWLVLVTGGGVVGASFLLSTFVTDRSVVERVNEVGLTVPDPVPVARTVGRALGIAGLAAILLVASFGPKTPTNGAVLAVWVGWWAGYVATAYLVGNSWTAVNPFRTLAEVLPTANRRYPSRLGAWPSVVGLLALGWIQVVTPVTRSPRALSVAVLAYVGVTALGSVAFGPETWFDRVDPLARLCRCYGAVAPVARTDDGWQVRLPGAGLSEIDLGAPGDRAFVGAICWVTTFEGLVHTPISNDVVGGAVGAGLPPSGVYLGVVALGFVLFWGSYRAAVGLARSRAGTLLSRPVLAGRFVVSLLPIAAGYHLASSLGYVLTWSPTLIAGWSAPFSQVGSPIVLVLPAWFGVLELLAVLGGHVLGIWVAHSVAYDLFPGRVQALRSQVPLVAVMIGYTVVGLWIVSQPSIDPVLLQP